MSKGRAKSSLNHRKKPRRLIFISYRRSDSADISGRVFDRLTLTYGRNSVIKDVNSFPPGVDFREHAAELIPQCTGLIVIIGPNWLSKGGKSKRALFQVEDMVRYELEIALAAGVPIIPVLSGGADLPLERRLPECLRPILRRHAVPLRGDPDFSGDVQRLIREL